MNISLTYNGQVIPSEIDKRLIISAFENPIDPDAVEQYRGIMEIQGIQGIAPITGYPDKLTEDDIENGVTFINGEVAGGSDVGKAVWYVTDGHHRSYAALNVDMVHSLPVMMDTTTFTDECELKAYRNALNE